MAAKALSALVGPPSLTHTPHVYATLFTPRPSYHTPHVHPTHASQLHPSNLRRHGRNRRCVGHNCRCPCPVPPICLSHACAIWHAQYGPAGELFMVRMSTSVGVITTKILYNQHAPVDKQMELEGLVPKLFLPECVRLAYYQSLDTAPTGTPLATSPLATSSLATSPLATSPLATSPLATSPLTSTLPSTDGMPTDPDEAAVVNGTMHDILPHLNADM